MGNTENASGRSSQTVTLLTCAQCGSLSSSHAWGWRGYRVDLPEENELPALAFWCPDCAAAEFDQA